MTRRPNTRRKRVTKPARSADAPRPVTAAELRALRREIEQRMRPGARAGTPHRASRSVPGRASKVAPKAPACVGIPSPTTCSGRLHSSC